MTTDARHIADALACEKPGCECNHPASNGKYLTHCPVPGHGKGHGDQHPSCSITHGNDGKVLVKCFAGCTQEAVIEALKKRGLWNGGNDVDGHLISPVLPSTRQHPGEKGQKEIQKAGSGGVDGSVDKAVNTPSTGLTLAELAAAKKVPEDFLKGLGLRDQSYRGEKHVLIPYVDAEGNVCAKRRRLSLTGEQRFAWNKGDHPLLYGLQRLSDIRSKGWVLLVEGESDCWTLWFKDLPALGIPGKTVWKKDWDSFLQGLEVYLWQEPGAEDLTERIGPDIPGLKIIAAPEGIKDPSEAHLQGKDLPAFLSELMGKAVSAAVLLKEKSNAQLAEIRKRAAPILDCGRDPFELVETAIRAQGYGGDIRPAKVCYLAATSRVLKFHSGAMPVHLLLLGPPSAGKSWTWGVVRNLLPGEAFYQIDAGSARVFIYSQEPLKHRVLVFAEEDSLPKSEDNSPSSAIRNLLQEHYLRYEVSVQDPETGDYTTRKIEKPGPCVLITTSTHMLKDQLSSRLFTLEVPYGMDQIRAAIESQVRLERNGSQAPDSALIAFQEYLQALAPWDVDIPFLDALGRVIATNENAPRILRDFARLISLIKSMAVIRHRQRRRNQQGRLIAELEDYETVRGLIADMYEGSVTGVHERTRQVVEAVKEMKANETAKVTVTGLAAHMKLDKGGISRTVRTAIKHGWLVNQEPWKNQPADLVIGEPLPARKGLPKIADLQPVDNALTPVDSRVSTGSEIGPQIVGNERVDGLTANPDGTSTTHIVEAQSQEVGAWKY